MGLGGGWEEVVVLLGEIVWDGVGDPAGAAASPLSGNPFASTTAPATTRATIRTIRAVPRFTGASYRRSPSGRPR